MENKQKAWNEMSKKMYELDDKRIELEKAKDQYKEELVNETIQNILNVLKEDGTLTERDLNIFVGTLAKDIKHLYGR